MVAPFNCIEAATTAVAVEFSLKSFPMMVGLATVKLFVTTRILPADKEVLPE